MKKVVRNYTYTPDLVKAVECLDFLRIPYKVEATKVTNFGVTRLDYKVTIGGETDE